MDSHLIVLRGPAGAGKSTVASRLLKTAQRPTALIEQDPYRFIFNVREGEAYSTTVREMIRSNILTALRNGFDVIAEGVFKARGYRPIFDSILRDHPHRNHFVYFNVSFEETLRRHRGRAKAGLFDEPELRGWYEVPDALGYDGEQIIDDASTLDATVERISSAARAAGAAR